MNQQVTTQRTPGAWKRFEEIRIEEAAGRIDGVLRKTRLEAFDSADERIELRLKFENEQETGSFKARGAWNQVSQLSEVERGFGICCPSSGNHGRAVSWAGQRAGVKATIFMPENAYPNKIQACRDHDAEVVLTPTRALSETRCLERVAEGGVLVHPYDAQRTLQGAGTVGYEIAKEWPEVEVVVTPVGGGGLLSGSSLAVRQVLGEHVYVIGAEPAGAPSMYEGLRAGEQVNLDSIDTTVQGLCPINSGKLNIAICQTTVDRVVLMSDEQIYAAQKVLVHAGHTVEPAGAAAPSLVLSGEIPEELLEGRSRDNRLRVACVVSGGNPDPAQIEAIRSQG